mgnify:CR=1 FL=1
MSKYNGHKNWNHWNVSLWINNDEGLYNTARGFVRRYCRDEAARYMLEDLQSMGMDETPDGAPYSMSSIKAAMVGM